MINSRLRISKSHGQGNLPRHMTLSFPIAREEHWFALGIGSVGNDGYPFPSTELNMKIRHNSPTRIAEKLARS